MKLDDKLAQELRNNEHFVQILPYDELVKEWEGRMSGVKTGVSYVAPAKDTFTAMRVLREFGVNPGQLLIKEYGGKRYVVFKGRPGIRKIFRGTRYLAENPKVVRMAVGPSGLEQAVKGGFVLTVVLSIGIEVFEYFIRDTATLSHLLGTITSDIVKIGISSIAGAAAGLAVGSAAVVGSIAAAPLIAAIAVGIITGWALNEIDKRTGATKTLIKAYEKIGLKLDEIEYEAARWYDYFENNPAAIMRLFGGGGPYIYGGY